MVLAGRLLTAVDEEDGTEHADGGEHKVDERDEKEGVALWIERVQF